MIRERAFLVVISLSLECLTGTVSEPQITFASVSLEKWRVHTRLAQFCQKVPEDYTNKTTRGMSRGTWSSFALNTHCYKQRAAQTNSVQMISDAIYSSNVGWCANFPDIKRSARGVVRFVTIVFTNETEGQKHVSTLPSTRRLCFHLCLFAACVVPQQDYTKTTKHISTKFGWGMGLSPGRKTIMSWFWSGRGRMEECFSHLL